jgi:hypothetical protein
VVSPRSNSEFFQRPTQDLNKAQPHQSKPQSKVDMFADFEPPMKHAGHSNSSGTPSAART